MTWQGLGLFSFVFTTVLTNAVLLFDYWLMRNDYRMITDYARANPAIAWAILTVVSFGTLGLAVHFMAPVPLGEQK